MKVEITIDKDDIKEAITAWLRLQPIAGHIQPNSLSSVSWTGGSIVGEDLNSLINGLTSQ